MVTMNDMDRFHLVIDFIDFIDFIDRTTGLGSRAASLR